MKSISISLMLVNFFFFAYYFLSNNQNLEGMTEEEVDEIARACIYIINSDEQPGDMLKYL